MQLATATKMESTMSLEPLLSLEEAARIVRRSHWSMRKYIADGKIRGVRIGRDLLIEPSELRRFIQESRE
jgi:excisionase family DNA binding protein